MYPDKNMCIDRKSKKQSEESQKEEGLTFSPGLMRRAVGSISSS